MGITENMRSWRRVDYRSILNSFSRVLTLGVTLTVATSAWAVEPGFGSAETELNGEIEMDADLMGADFMSGELTDGLVTTRVVDIMDPIRSGEDYRVFSYSDGRIFKVAAKDEALLAEVRQAQVSGAPINLIVDGSQILSITYPDASSEDADLLGIGILSVDGLFQDKNNEADRYEPTRLSSVAQASSLFANQHRSFKRKSQCYQRAQVWAYDMYRSNSIKSMKAFLFFTSRYIRAYDYDWWFHVTPFVYVGETEYTLDRTFTKSPLTMRQWTNVFMHNDANCPVINNYYEYRNNQNSQWCYLRQVPMYYFQPLSIEKRDSKGILSTQFTDWEIRNAYSARR